MIATAWDSARTFRGSDMRGGAYPASPAALGACRTHAYPRIAPWARDFHVFPLWVRPVLSLGREGGSARAELPVRRRCDLCHRSAGPRTANPPKVSPGNDNHFGNDALMWATSSGLAPACLRAATTAREAPKSPRGLER